MHTAGTPQGLLGIPRCGFSSHSTSSEKTRLIYDLCAHQIRSRIHQLFQSSSVILEEHCSSALGLHDGRTNRLGPVSCGHRLLLRPLQIAVRTFKVHRTDGQELDLLQLRPAVYITDRCLELHTHPCGVSLRAMSFCDEEDVCT